MNVEKKVEAPPAVSPEGAVTEGDRTADAAGERAFAAALFGALGKEKRGNLFVSPASARFAMSMVLAGARGDTAKELTALLGATPRSHDVAATLAKDWAKLATPPSNYEWEKNQVVVLRTANRLFGQRGQAFLPPFVELTKARYGAPIEAVEFSKDASGARRTINDWVAARTEQRIKDILTTDLPRETKLVLANAIYFKAPWVDAFEERATKVEPFFGASGTTSVPMMRKTHARKYADLPDAHIVDLPYGSERRPDIVMTLIIPKKTDGLAELEKSLSPATLQKWAWAASSLTTRTEVDLLLPKFRIESELSLGGTLEALGAGSVFKFGKADLSGIDVTKELFVGLVLQKTFVAVDEKGTEAAAATVVAAIGGGMPPAPPKPVVVRADRPFLFMIRDVPRDRMLFIGRLAEPKG
ncbi:MAG: serpin family protein [Myxococcales bacterium]|nr:serpin family protein [Myxococcales bacterium]